MATRVSVVGGKRTCGGSCRSFSSQLGMDCFGVVSFLPCLRGIQMHPLILQGRRSCGEAKEITGFNACDHCSSHALCKTCAVFST